MSLFFYNPAEHEFHGIRVQVQIDQEIRRRYFNFRGKSVEQRNKMIEQAKRLDAKWMREARKVWTARKLSRNGTNAGPGALGITGITLGATCNRGHVSLVLISTGGSKLRQTAVFDRRPFDEAWKIAVDKTMKLNSYPEHYREIFMAHKPDSKRLRKYIKYVREHRGYVIETERCRRIGWW